MLQEHVEGQQCHSDSIPRLELCAAKLAAIWRDILVRESGESFCEIIMFFPHFHIFFTFFTVFSWMTVLDIQYNLDLLHGVFKFNLGMITLQ